MQFRDHDLGRRITRLLCASALLLSGAASANVMNGDFSAGLTDWVVTGGPPGPPDVSDGGGFALLRNDGTSGFRTLEQTFGVPGTGSALSFDFHFATVANQDNGDDAFNVYIETAGAFLSILSADDSLGITLDPDFPAFSATPLGVAVATGASTPIPGTPTPGGTTHFGTVSLVLPASVWGMDATLIFELTDGNPSFDTLVAVDNVRVSATVVPEPPLFALLLGGMMAIRCCRPRARGD